MGGVELDTAAAIVILQRLPEHLAWPSTRRLDYGDPYASARVVAHLVAMLDHEPGYLDPKDQLFVFTAVTHLGRGYCCNNLCRHCPYVNGPRRPSWFAIGG